MTVHPKSIVWLATVGAIVLMSEPSSATAQPGPEPQLVHVLASDFAFVIDRTILPAGPVQIEMTNLSDQLKHELWVYPIDERDREPFQEMLELKRTGQRADEPSFISDIFGRSGEVAAGDATTFTIDFLPAGVYEFACLAREGSGDIRQVHYDEGMYAAFAVRPTRGT
ncbi:MAG TPA: hypothetical protein VGK54_07200 [Chloroflexota bacterium]